MLNRSDPLQFQKIAAANDRRNLVNASLEASDYAIGKRKWQEERDNKKNQILSQSRSPKEAQDLLVRGGFSDEANKIRLGDQKYETGQLDNAAKAFEVVQQATNSIGSQPTEANGLTILSTLNSQYGINTDPYKQQLLQLGNDPRKISEWAARTQLDAKEELSSDVSSDLGGSIETRRVDPVTGQSTLSRTDQRTLTPAQAASNEVSRGNLGIARERLALDKDKRQYDREIDQAARQDKAIASESEQMEIADKEKKAMRTVVSDSDIVMRKIDQAVDQIDWNSTGMIGGYLSLIRGSDASNLEKTLKTVSSKIGFGQLQKMRDASKTGGAVGNLSEKELDVLSSAIAALDIDQDAGDLRRNLEEVRRSYKGWKDRVDSKAFKKERADYERTALSARQEELQGVDALRDLRNRGINPNSREGQSYIRNVGQKIEGNVSTGTFIDPNRKSDWSGDDRPSPKNHVGATMFDKDTGLTFTSNGKNWVKGP